MTIMCLFRSFLRCCILFPDEKLIIQSCHGYYAQNLKVALIVCHLYETLLLASFSKRPFCCSTDLHNNNITLYLDIIYFTGMQKKIGGIEKLGVAWGRGYMYCGEMSKTKLMVPWKFENTKEWKTQKAKKY